MNGSSPSRPKARSAAAKSSEKEFVDEAFQKMGATQCDDSGPGAPRPTGGIRLNVDAWPVTNP